MLLTQCPHHHYPISLLTQFFYDGLTLTGQALVDTAAGGYYGDKTAEEVREIYEMLAMNSRQKAVRGKRAGVYELQAQSDLQTQVADLSRQMKTLMTHVTTSTSSEVCNFCGMIGHSTNGCMNMNQP